MTATFYQGSKKRQYLHETPGMYSYDDMLMLAPFPACNLDRIREIDMDPKDLMVVGYPRSGKMIIRILC